MFGVVHSSDSTLHSHDTNAGSDLLNTAFEQSVESVSGTACRRTAVREPLPIEASVFVGDQEVSAVIRDVSINPDPSPLPFGIGILHQQPLPLEQPVRCRLAASSETLPEDFMITLVWTRKFGERRYLSGGHLSVNSGQ